MSIQDDPEFSPSPEQAALFPDISGNEINGLGETVSRNPTPVYWRPPETIPHGSLIKFFYAQGADNPASNALRAERAADQERPQSAVADKKRTGSPEEFASQVKNHALAHEGDDIGITALNPEWVFEDSEVPHRWVILISVLMDYDEMQQAPSTEENRSASLEVQKQYNRVSRAVLNLTNWIREQGYDAMAHPGPQSGKLLMIPHAIEAGLGELGKHGSMIHRRFGAMFRLGAVTTDMPLVPDAPDDLGVDSFCANCQLCAKACPPKAIFDTKQMVRGVEKWYVDFDKCVGFFNESYGCAACLPACPWSRPGLAPGLAEKMARKKDQKL